MISHFDLAYHTANSIRAPNDKLKSYEFGVILVNPFIILIVHKFSWQLASLTLTKWQPTHSEDTLQ